VQVIVNENRKKDKSLLINFRRASQKKIPNLESMPMASATSDTSAPVASHTADMVLILEIRWAEEQHDFEKKKTACILYQRVSVQEGLTIILI
jgi:hypothetical protein